MNKLSQLEEGKGPGQPGRQAARQGPETDTFLLSVEIGAAVGSSSSLPSGEGAAPDPAFPFSLFSHPLAILSPRNIYSCSRWLQIIIIVICCAKLNVKTNVNLKINPYLQRYQIMGTIAKVDKYVTKLVYRLMNINVGFPHNSVHVFKS